jgi:hypothetical protein
MLKRLEPPVLLTFVDPGQHSQREERLISSCSERKRSIFAGLDYVLPSAFDIYADKWVADCQNGMPTTHSRPSSADILFTGHRRTPHYKFPNLSFGAVCMVKQHVDKRKAQARINERSYKSEPVAELGIMLGNSVYIPGDFDFLVANGQVVPRRVVEQIQVHPPDGFANHVWRRKVVHRAEMSVPSVFPPREFPILDAAVRQDSAVSSLSSLGSVAFSFESSASYLAPMVPSLVPVSEPVSSIPNEPVSVSAPAPALESVPAHDFVLPSIPTVSPVFVSPSSPVRSSVTATRARLSRSSHLPTVF